MQTGDIVKRARFNGKWVVASISPDGSNAWLASILALYPSEHVPVTELTLVGQATYK